MQNRLRLLATAFALVLSNVVIHADTGLDYYSSMNCDAQKGIAHITIYASANGPFEEKPRDCLLPDQTTVRFKLGLMPERISVWVNKAKVLNQILLSCHGEGPCNPSIEVTREGVRQCQVSLIQRNEFQDEEVRTHCVSTALRKGTASRDSIEYPETGEKIQPKVGSTVMLYAQNPTLCAKLQIDNRLPVGSKEFFTPDTFPYEHSGSYSLYSFDINNDGKPESVLGLSAQTHYRDGSIFFINSQTRSLSDYASQRGSSMSESTFAKSAIRVLPQYWAGYTDKYERELADHNNDDAGYVVKAVGAPWWDKNDVPVFRFRYWSLLPFQYDHTTYFVARSEENDKAHWRIVLRPEPDYSVTEICVLQRVRAHY